MGTLQAVPDRIVEWVIVDPLDRRLAVASICSVHGVQFYQSCASYGGGMNRVRRHTRFSAVLLVLARGAAGCGSSGSNTESSGTIAAEDSTSEDSVPDASEAAAFPDQGDMKVTLEDATNEDDEVAKGLLDTTRSVHDVAALINETVVLPTDTAIVFTSDDDGTGPHYAPDDLQITFPYSFVGFIADTIKKNDPEISDEDLAIQTDNAVDFILLHEIGHALVHQLEIPLLSKEEDAADNIATVLLSVGGAEGGDIALSGATLFAYLQEDPSDLSESAFWDEHSLDLQRANQTACLVYGSDTNAFADLEEIIPEERLVRCPGEWDQIAKGVRTVLEPYLKP